MLNIAFPAPNPNVPGSGNRRAGEVRRFGAAANERVRTSDHRKSGLTRDYFRVETRDGQRFWIYRDGLYAQDNLQPRWYLQGLFA